MMDGMGFGCGGSSLGLKDKKDQTYVLMLNFLFDFKAGSFKKRMKKKSIPTNLLALFVLTELLRLVFLLSSNLISWLRLHQFFRD